MATKCFTALKGLQRFHRDEQGMEALQSVTIFALAALVMTGVYWIWDKAKIGGKTEGLRGGVVTAVDGVFSAFAGFGNGGSGAATTTGS